MDLIKVAKAINYFFPSSNSFLSKTKKIRRLGYSQYFVCKDFEIFNPKPGLNRILASFNKVFITGNLSINPYQFTIHVDISHPNLKKIIKLNKNTFPGLIPNSKIANVLILKYLREEKQGIKVKSWRIVVFTDKCQIYHNFPDRSTVCSGKSIDGDYARFDESVVWDLPGRRFPKKSRDCSIYEQYYPGLPEDCYKVFPKDCSNEDFVDLYKNGGFNKY